MNCQCWLLTMPAIGMLTYLVAKPDIPRRTHPRLVSKLENIELVYAPHLYAGNPQGPRFPIIYPAL